MQFQSRRVGLAAQRFEIGKFGVRGGFEVKSWHHDIQTGAGAFKTQTDEGQTLESSLMSGSQHTPMLRQVDNITAAELRGYFLLELPKLTDVERARCERYIESLAAFECGEQNSTHPANTTLQ
jgi:hypothetical protein